VILRDRLKFVLMEPSHAGNIGSAARAMKVMGFHRLAVVSPREKDPGKHPEALAFASRATDILDNLQIYSSLDEALADSQLNIAVSAEGREFGPQAMSPEALAERLFAEFSPLSASKKEADAPLSSDSAAFSTPSTWPSPSSPVAPLSISLIFGTERTGLPIEIVQRCQWMCAIPTMGEYNSLNLAQAVQVLAYVLGRHSGLLRMPEVIRQNAQDTEAWASDQSIEAMFVHLEATLVKIDFLDPAHPKKLMPRLRRLFARSRLTNKELDILRGILSQVAKKV
jgi:tRNA/rRNA methyltransferase